MKKVSIVIRENVKYSNENKQIDEMIKESFKNLELDKINNNTNEWNPLGDNLIKQGDIVLIKPNMVLEKNSTGLGEDCLYTNPCVVEAVIPYVWKALKGKGKIIVADAPVQSCDFQSLIIESGYKDLIQRYQKKGINIELKDLRGLISRYENGILNQEMKDEEEAIIVDIRKNSEHAKLENNKMNRLRIANYNPEELLRHHNSQKHEYLIAKEALEADVIINMPKPKAHRIAGVTLGLKNFIGINVRKEFLPHHRLGDLEHGGDEYEKSSVLLRGSSKLLDKANYLKYKKNFKKAKIMTGLHIICSKIDQKFGSKEKNRVGGWYGNDTIWRTIIDVNRIIKYADKNGKMKDNPQRKIFTIADMIVVGEKEGPLKPSPKYAGMIAMGEDLVCFDEMIATILGFDIKKIPLFKHLREKRKWKLVDENEFGIIVSNSEKFNNKRLQDITRKEAINIEPTSGWKNHIELE